VNKFIGYNKLDINLRNPKNKNHPKNQKPSITKYIDSRASSKTTACSIAAVFWQYMLRLLMFK